MTHKYTEFDSVALPQYEPQQAHDAMGMRPALVRVSDGVFDIRGTGTGSLEPDNVLVTGTYTGNAVYLVDEDGNYLVDEDGAYLTMGESLAWVRVQVASIRAKVRQRGTLWRAQIDSETTRQWKTARLLNVRQNVSRNQPLSVAELTLEFETAMKNWHAETVTEYSQDIAAGTTTTLMVENAGTATIEDATLTLTCYSGTLTAVTLACDTLGVDLSWAGSVATGEQLIIDLSDNSVASGGVDAYDDFTLGAGHTQKNWLDIEPGTHFFEILLTGGAAEVTFSFYEQEP